MTSKIIHESALKLLKRCDSRNPFKIAEEIGVHVLFRNDFVQLKGMYTIIKRNRFIFINANLDECKQRIICAHELGHDTIHREFAKEKVLQEFTLYDMSTRPEYEANVFAAELLIDDNEVFELAQEGFTEQQIASELYTDMNLLLIKMQEMNKRGYNFNLSEVPRGDFLGRQAFEKM